MENKDEWGPFLDETFEYIKCLKDPAGNYMHRSSCKTGFIGFMVGIKSCQGLFEDLVGRPGAPLKYLLPYKFSQDHLELFFGSVRAAGGCNNNPTVRQFVAIYKRLLLRSSIGGGRGNCLKLDETNILHIMGDVCKVEDTEVTMSDVALIRKYDLEHRNPEECDHDYEDTPNFSSTNLSEFKKPVIAYISGSAGKITARNLWCKECCDALGSKQHIAHSLFIEQKDRGGLFKPSVSVIKICEETEVRFQRMLRSTGGKLPRSKGKGFNYKV